MDQIHLHHRVVTRHAHLSALRQLNMPSDVSRPEEELRPIVAEERLVTPTLSLSQHIHLTLELLMRRDRTRLAQHLTPLDLLLLRTPKKSTDVVTRLPLIKQLPDHLNTRARRLQIGRASCRERVCQYV